MGLGVRSYTGLSCALPRRWACFFTVQQGTIAKIHFTGCVHHYWVGAIIPWRLFTVGLFPACTIGGVIFTFLVGISSSAWLSESSAAMCWCFQRSLQAIGGSIRAWAIAGFISSMC